ncbi:MAG: hypothetical protein WCW64_00500 [Phycisphaerae bacterium]|jgi:hypothetical protein
MSKDIQVGNNIIELEHSFDRKTCRHSISGFQSVLHCHHYMTLTTQMAEDADDLCQGTEVLISTMENTAYKVLSKICNENNIKDIEDKINVAEELFCRIWALGKIKFIHLGDFSATIDVLHSHIDEGWTKKWKKRDKPVGYINRGFIQGALAVINNVPAGSFETQESECIVSGAKKGIIRAWKR